MKSRQARLSLLGLALGVLLALVIAPQTRWLVRLQALTALRLYHPLPARNAPPPALPVPYTTSSQGDQARYEAVAARHPNDYAVQYAAAVADNSHDETLAGLHALAARFPDRPTLYANLLRYETLGKVHLERPEENLLLGLPLSHKYGFGHSNAPADLAAFDADAAAGERLDPDNAYFPLMRAVGLFAAFRDAEGLAAFRRASIKPSWREYCVDEVKARWRLHEEAFGDPGALGRVSIAASLLLPQYSQLRALARLILVKAVQQEAAGHREEGLQLREALRRCGDLMRAQTTYVIGSLVGNAICAIATDRTGGMTQGTASDPVSDQQIWQRLDAYRAYATRLGHPEFAAREQAEAAAGQQMSAIVRFDDPTRLSQLNQPFLSLTRWWLVDIAVLSNVFWLLLLGGPAAGLMRLMQVREAGERPAWDWVALLGRVGAACGLLLLTAFVAVLFANLWAFVMEAAGWQMWVGGLALLLLTVLAVRAVFRALLRMPAWRRQGILWASGILLLSGAGLSGLWHLLVWQAGGLPDIMDGTDSLLNLSGGGDAAEARQALVWRLSLAAVSAAPLLLLLVSGVIALVRRAPVSTGLVRGFASAALPLACLLLLVWGGLLLGTVRQEGVVNVQIWHEVHDEGPYLAAQMGKPWPGPVQ